MILLTYGTALQNNFSVSDASNLLSCLIQEQRRMIPSEKIKYELKYKDGYSEFRVALYLNPSTIQFFYISLSHEWLENGQNQRLTHAVTTPSSIHSNKSILTAI